MSPQLIFRLIHRSRERGFTIALAVGFGLLMALVGVTMLVRSSGDRLNTSTDRAIASSGSIAELGITRYLNLLNTYRAIATFSACGDDSLRDTGTCTDNTNPSWFNSTAIPNINTSAFASTSPACGESPIADLVRSFANQQWQDIEPNDSEQGQVRLIDYTFNAATNTGTLTVEGRIRQEGSGQSATQATGTAIERLQVRIPVNPDSALLPTGLWINWNPTAGASGSVEIRGNITDSTPCEDSDDNQAANLQIYQSPPQMTLPGQTFSYTSKPGFSFPPLPARGAAPPPGAIDDLPNGKITNATGTLPRVGDAPVGDRYTYHLTNTSNSLLLNGGILTVDAPGQTVELYLDGPMNINGGGYIDLSPSTKLIIYAHHKVVLTGASTVYGPINNTGTPDLVQIYSYATNPSTQPFRLSGGSGASFFVFAPSIPVEQSGTTTVGATIWSRSWIGSGSAIFTQRDDIDPENLEVDLPPTIGTPTSWRREEVP